MNEYKFNFYSPEEKLPDKNVRLFFGTGDEIYTGYFIYTDMGGYFENDFGKCFHPDWVVEWSYMEV